MGERTTHELRYRFPYTYRALAADGRPLHAREGSLDWRWGAPMAGPAAVSAEGGYGEVIYDMGRFRVPPPGRIRVKAHVRPDAEHGATVHSMEIRVRDRVPRAIWETAGAVLFYLGPVAFSAGAVLFVVGLVRRKGRCAPKPAEAEQAP